MMTNNFSDFGTRELRIAAKLIQAWIDQGLPSGFENSGVEVYLNTNSGYVFLTNSEYQTIMMNGDKLEEWHVCPECGHEGFLEEMNHGQPGTWCERYVSELKS